MQYWTSDQAPQKPTLRTIAELTGFAVTTVSRALGGAPEIAQETRDRVNRVAAEIGYVPDRAAQRLRTGKTNVISLILNPHEEILRFGSSLVSGLTNAFRGSPFHLVVTPHFANSTQLEPVQHIVRNRQADGIVFSRTEPNDPRAQFLIENKFPFISHGRTELETPHGFVDFDNFEFAYQAVKRLVEAGRSRIAVILPPTRFTFHKHLKGGFMKAVEEFKIDYDLLEGIDLDNSSAEIYDHIVRRLSGDALPDGYVCGGEVSALAVVAGLTDKGFVPGRDVGIVAKQTSGLFDLFRPKIDVIYEDIEEAGLQMGKLLMKQIAGEDPASLQFLQHPRGLS